MVVKASSAGDPVVVVGTVMGIFCTRMGFLVVVVTGDFVVVRVLLIRAGVLIVVTSTGEMLILIRLSSGIGVVVVTGRLVTLVVVVLVTSVEVGGRGLLVTVPFALIWLWTGGSRCGMIASCKSTGGTFVVVVVLRGGAEEELVVLVTGFLTVVAGFFVVITETGFLVVVVVVVVGLLLVVVVVTADGRGAFVVFSLLTDWKVVNSNWPPSFLSLCTAGVVANGTVIVGLLEDEMLDEDDDDCGLLDVVVGGLVESVADTVVVVMGFLFCRGPEETLMVVKPAPPLDEADDGILDVVVVFF